MSEPASRARKIVTDSTAITTTMRSIQTRVAGSRNANGLNSAIPRSTAQTSSWPRSALATATRGAPAGSGVVPEKPHADEVGSEPRRETNRR